MTTHDKPMAQVYQDNSMVQAELEMRELEVTSKCDSRPMQQGRPQQQRNCLEWCRYKAAEKLVQSLPYSKAVDMEDLETRGYARWLALANAIFYATLLFSFIGTGTVTELNRKFLALTEPKSSDAYCEPISVAITGVYQADTKGSWSTQKEFDPSRTIYELTMTGSTLTPQQYKNHAGFLISISDAQHHE